ncbi:MAG: hypothetical protein R8K22_01060, partial [Mariprofundaceae bacterium]
MIERGVGYEYANFIPALRRLGHDVVFFESWDKKKYRDFADLNRNLLHVFQEEKPDVLFCVMMTCEIWLETLQLMCDSDDVALINWATDDSWKYDQCSRFVASYFDLHATTYPSALEKSLKDGLNNVVLTQWAADSGRMKPPLKASQCQYRVSFVGSSYGDRKGWVDSLQQRGIKVDTFGFGWPNGCVADEDVAKIIRDSQISLNFADSGVVIEDSKVTRSRQIKARVFEVPGAGG